MRPGRPVRQAELAPTMRSVSNRKTRQGRGGPRVERCRLLRGITEPSLAGSYDQFKGIRNSHVTFFEVGSKRFQNFR